MEIAIVTFRPDPASMNIRQSLLSLYEWEESGLFDSHLVMHLKTHVASGNVVRLYLMESKSVDAELANNIDCDILIFATKHESTAGKDSLCVHAPGNWNGNELGGKEQTLCISPALLIREAYLHMKKQVADGFEITVEQTHHGPSVTKPIMFIEIGSNIDAWQDSYAGSIIAETIFYICNITLVERECVLVFGGGHYNQATNKILEQTELCVGHSCAKFHLEKLTKDVVLQGISKSIPEASFVVIDWKSLGNEQQKRPLLDILDELDIEVKRLKEII
jgi:D-aminoacyl-tRNA deacylase